MKCTNPYTFRNPHYGVCGDTRPYITVPCGRCICCRNRKRNQWAFRLEQECKICHTAYFITLTYDDEHLPFDDDCNSVLRYRDVQLFFKRLRSYYPDSNIRYLCVGEYGERFGRPHYHAIVFNIPVLSSSFHRDRQISTLLFNKHLSEIWKNGFVHSGSVTRKSILYCTKYCFKSDSLMRCSKRPFLGYSFLNCSLIEQMCNDVNKLRVVSQHGQVDGKPITWFLQIPDIYLRNMFKYKDLTNEQVKKYTIERFISVSRDNSRRDSSPYQSDEQWFKRWQDEKYGGRYSVFYIPQIIHDYVTECSERLSRLRDYERRYLLRKQADEASRFARHKKNSPREYTLFT